MKPICSCGPNGPYRQPVAGLGDFCAVCHAGPLPSVEDVQAERLAEALAPLLARPAAGPVEPAPTPPPERLLSAREVAALLRRDRVKTLPKLVAAGLLHPIRFGAEHRFHAGEVEQLVRQGLPADVPGIGRRPPTPRASAGEPTREGVDAERSRPSPAAARRARRSRGGSATARAISSIPLTTTTKR